MIIIEEEVFLQPSLESGYRFIVLDVEVFIFDTAPEALDEDIVEDSALSIHTDTDVSVFQGRGEGQGGELSALIGVEDLRGSLPEGHLESLKAEVSLQRVG